MRTLPNKLSQLILVALKDLELCEKDPNYRVNMHTWHGPANDMQLFGDAPYCVVCLAGAVMAQSLEAPKENVFVPDDFKEDSRKLVALDYVINGCTISALVCMEQKTDFPILVPITPYAEDPIQFKADLFKLADELQAEGL